MIHTGDCLPWLKSLPDGYADIVVTSPPYNQSIALSEPSGMRANWNFTNNWQQTYEDERPEPEYQAWLRSVVSECLRVARGLVWINHKIRYRAGVGIHPLHFLPFPVYAEVVWNRRGGIAFNCKRYAPSHELVYGFGRPHWWDNRHNARLSVWDINPNDAADCDHPCPFPVVLPRRLIESSCPPSGRVLDPFAGSGSTGVACIQSGREFIGCELDARYAEMARQRIDESRGVGGLFPPAPAELYAA